MFSQKSPCIIALETEGAASRCNRSAARQHRWSGRKLTGHGDHKRTACD